MLEYKIISSLEKCFPDQNVSDFDALNELSVLSNERVSFQLIVKTSGDTTPHRAWAKVVFGGALAGLASVRTVECIPSMLPCYPGVYDDNYLRTEKGLYPDLLLPVGNFGRIPLTRDELRAYWITVELDGSVTGREVLTIDLVDDAGNVAASAGVTLNIINAKLPKQEITVTQWFHGDCLATYYDCKVFSAKWWKIVENFVKVAVRNGQNMLLTPVFTPPLDTAVGHERPTVQLVDVKVEDGKYSFGYKNLDRWIRMCNRTGIKYFEISHFFTQWGAAHAPKVMAEVDGVQNRIFGWDTDASGAEYTAFLRAFIVDFIDHMKKLGCDRRCVFHISDEPNEKNLEQYEKSRNTVIDLLKDYTVMDALSNVAFWEKGIVTTPVPSNNHIEPFLAAGIKDLWTYYCCGQSIGVSNRYFAMPSYRNRYIGFQFWKYDIVGFLQWGYNFYYSQYSLSAVNPYLDSTGNYFVPSGDTYSVYPAEDGSAHESLRLAVFYEALQDLRALKLCEKLVGRETTLNALEEITGNIVFSDCARSADIVLKAREKINSLIAANING